MNRTIALLMITGACALPLYSQEETRQQTQSARSVSDKISEDFRRKDAHSSGETEISQQAESRGTNATETAGQDYAFPIKRERFDRYVSDTVGVSSLLRAGLSAGIGQWRDQPVEWVQGASGFGKRYASRVGQTAIHQTVTYGLDQALGLDTGFEKSKRKGFFPRMKHALAENITSRTKTGKRVISVPRLAGVYASGVVPAETWYPSRYSYKDGLRSATHSLVTGFGLNLIREFLVDW